MGGGNPGRVQAMTTTDTLDTNGTASQIERMVAAGCEIARVTAPSLKEAENLAEIRRELRRRGVRVPLVADIHFTPNAALVAAEHVEKVRINPGNFADKKKFAVREYDDAQWREEVERAAARFRPLVRRCKELGRALRIGTNHGSLSDRIMNRFGDTALGMVESALEFLDVCEDERFRAVVFSMKSSNAQVAIQAYRLLAARLEERAPGAPSYPFHVGVTEAGDAEDGRVKSSIGIGSLLEDGIGDTIRVSLTEDPVKEVPVAAALARHCQARWALPRTAVPDPGAPFVDDPFAHRRRATRSVGREPYAIGGEHPVRVELDLGPLPADPRSFVLGLRASLARLPELACEALLLEVLDPEAFARLPVLERALAEAGLDAPLAVRGEPRFLADCGGVFARAVVTLGALIGDDEIEDAARAAAERGFPLEWELRGRTAEIAGLLDRALAASAGAGLENLLVSVDAELPVRAVRLAAARLRARGAADVPVFLRHRRIPRARPRSADRGRRRPRRAALRRHRRRRCACGWEDPGTALDLAYRILQGGAPAHHAHRVHLLPLLRQDPFRPGGDHGPIKARTQHLSGVKIAIMGCIVNVPGEMADADSVTSARGPAP